MPFQVPSGWALWILPGEACQRGTVLLERTLQGSLDRSPPSLQPDLLLRRWGMLTAQVEFSATFSLNRYNSAWGFVCCALKRAGARTRKCSPHICTSHEEFPRSGALCSSDSSPQGHSAVSGDILSRHNSDVCVRVPLASSGWRSGMQLKTLQGTGQTPPQRVVQPGMSIVLKLRNFGLDNVSRSP